MVIGTVEEVEQNKQLEQNKQMNEANKKIKVIAMVDLP